MNVFYSKRALMGLAVVVVAVSSFCGIATHHVASMPNMSPSCGVGYFLTMLPQSSQERGMLSALLGILVLLALYPIARFRTGKGILREPYSSLSLQENTRSPDLLVELFRRGILNPKIYDLVLIRN